MKKLFFIFCILLPIFIFGQVDRHRANIDWQLLQFNGMSEYAVGDTLLVLHNGVLYYTVAVEEADDTTLALFVKNTGLTDNTQISVMCDLYNELKAVNLDEKLIAVHPFAGSTSTTQKYNLLDPRNLDVAYRLTFTNTAHADSGVTGNGSSAYVNTHIIASAQGDYNDFCFGVHFHSAVTVGGAYGVVEDTDNRILVYTRYNASSYIGDVPGYSNRKTISSTDSTGLWQFYTENDTMKIVRNGTIKGNTGTLTEVNMPDDPFYLLASNNGGAATFDAATIDFFYYGYGLTSEENKLLEAIIYKCLTGLSRDY